MEIDYEWVPPDPPSIPAPLPFALARGAETAQAFLPTGASGNAHEVIQRVIDKLRDRGLGVAGPVTPEHLSDVLGEESQAVEARWDPDTGAWRARIHFRA